MAGYIGTGAVPQATQKRDSFTTTANQTSFPTSGYTPGFVDVYMNGVKLAPADFTATNSSDVVLAVAAAANDTLEVISYSTFDVSAQTFTGDVTASGGTFLPTGDTSAGDAAAMGYAAADGLVLTGQGSTSDVTIKNDADATVMSIPTGTTGVTFAGTPTFPDGSINIADLDIDGGTDIGAALVDADLMVVDDGAGGTNRKATMSRLAAYMGTKIGGGAYNLLQTVTASDDATVSIGSSSLLTTTYSVYEIHVAGLIPATDNAVLRGRVEIGGSSISASNYDYWTFDVNSSSQGTPVRRATSVTFFEVVTNMDNPSSGATNFVLRFYNPASTALLKTWDYSGSSKDNNLTRMKLITGAAGYTDGTAALTGYNFFASSGNITSGVFKLYGIA